MTKRTTMADLAKRTGLSKSTISRALADDPRVKPATREKIKALAAELNYRPHPLASGLARRRTHTIGLAVPSPPRSFSHPFYLEFVGGVGDYAVTKGYSLFFAGPNDVIEAERGSGHPLAALADGFILTEPAVNDPRIEPLIRLGKPFIFLGSTEPLRGAAGGGEAPRFRTICVEGDNVGGSEMVVRHLIELGHRHIGCIAGSSEQVSTYNRLEGYRRAMRSAGIAVHDRMIASGDFTEAGGRSAVSRLLETFPEVTAVFACSDLMAIGAMQRLHEMGRAVPSEISVAGFDGIYLARLYNPSLTTAVQPIYQLGEVAARLLISQIEGEPVESTYVVLPCTLHEGASTAPPPGLRQPSGLR